ncbi:MULTISPECIES: ABC transporter permease [unclassified Luteococcus]|uniref:ABC transporter permease n=1 Tax=unclassified Luteococcus TaxID=2639923 RepID=UPI00313DA2F8
MIVTLGWQLGLALVLLVALGVAASRAGRLGHEKSMLVSSARAALQLAAVSFIIVICLRHLALAALFSLLMFVVAVRTTAQRTGVGSAWPWTTLAMACGVLPVLAVVFGTGVSPLSGAALVPVAGIIIGNMMTAHTLVGRRQFAALRDDVGTYEAALSLGMDRHRSIRLVTERTAGEALVPNLDTTRTVGLVTLPGAFVGVLLGGGSALQAGAAQVLVLIGIMAGQAITIVVANELIARAKLLPADLREALHP